MDSILTSIKKMLGIVEEYEHFDPELIMYINSAFMVLNQLGVGPIAPFTISDSEACWSDFASDGDIEAVRSYVYLKVKLIFDPPSSSFVLESINKQIAELEWRMNVICEQQE